MFLVPIIIPEQEFDSRGICSNVVTAVLKIFMNCEFLMVFGSFKI